MNYRELKLGMENYQVWYEGRDVKYVYRQGRTGRTLLWTDMRPRPAPGTEAGKAIAAWEQQHAER